MERDFGKILCLFIIVLVGACGRVDLACNTEAYEMNKYNSTVYHWPSGSNIQFQFAAAVPSDLRTSVKAAAGIYNGMFKDVQISFLDSYTAPAQTSKTNVVTGDGVNGIYYVQPQDWPFAKTNPEASAMTVNNYSANGILETDVFFLGTDGFSTMAQAGSPLLNGWSETFSMISHNLFDDFNRARATTIEAVIANSPLTTTDLTSVKAEAFSVHELGHVLGRCHTSNPNSIMQPVINSTLYETNPFIDSYDKDMLSKEYELN